MQYDPRNDLLYLNNRIDNLENKLNKTIKIIIQLEEIINEFSSKKNGKECRSE